ncbi:antigen 5 like allergen Cul n 1 [Drosophila mojavensis]|uniref:SCP domain-containing protein n=1 Tax=Drosophila mojavensis TaxID=7230 RepID=B4KAM2_DROMO|nr:antigen 5 like allergen Cul n 1 [Drosophila mojavensis]EDW16759.1 uncharacterized protein Dmoj_GI22050 [Drosophila mojavensis]
MSSVNYQQLALALHLCLLGLAMAAQKTADIPSDVYCKTVHCGVRNIGCHSSKNMNMSTTCAPDAKMVNLFLHKAHLLHLFNSFRNKVALGYTSSLYPAGRMARMAWSRELENFAIIYMKKCRLYPRPCMSSPEFTTIGSIYDGLTYTGSVKLHKVPEITEELLAGWFEDARFVTRAMMMSLTNEFPKPSVRQAVLLMADRNTHVGCSGMRFSTGISHQFNLVCAFATDNMLNRPIYRPWAEAGALCKVRDRTYKNLCAVGEVYNNKHVYRPGELLPAESDRISGVDA